MRSSIAWLAGLGFLAGSAIAQVTTGQILGVVLDPSGAVVSDAAVAVRNLQTNETRRARSDEQGLFLLPQLPVGSYEVTIEKKGFAPYEQGPIVLRLNQDADLRVRLELAGVVEKVTVRADAPLINANDAEVGVNFTTKRISELPVAANRHVLNLALSVAGVSQLQPGQATTALFGEGSIPFAVNGMRVRSNNFMVDGQDSNYAIITGQTQTIHNPDVVAEFRLVTNQFTAQYGGAGSVVNMITKAGTNQFHGSAFWFHNDNHLNSLSNLDKRAFSSSPFRTENQFGGTLGGPVNQNQTFFFISAQRWTDRRLGSGASIRGVPTAEGQSLLRPLAATRSTVRALLDHLPPAQQAVPGLAAPVVVAGNRLNIPVGLLSGSSTIRFDDWQWSGRVDHRFREKHSLGFRYLGDDRVSTGDGQVTPPGLSEVTTQSKHSLSAFLTSSFSAHLHNELRLSYGRFVSNGLGLDPRASQIPSIEIPELGLTGQPAGPLRTAIGLAISLPRTGFSNIYQLQDTASLIRGPHAMKFGIDFRNTRISTFILLRSRGALVYSTLQDLVDDTAQFGQIVSPLPGGELVQHYDYKDYFAFWQDEWRVRPRLSLTFGLRYEAPGNPFAAVAALNERILSAAGGDRRFDYGPTPQRDTNNWAPRFGFNYRLNRLPGFLGRLTGDDGSVIRGGYARTYDFVFVNIARNVLQSFPFVKSVSLTPRTPNSLEALRNAAATPITGDTNLLARTIVSPNFRSPFAEQLALQLQRQLGADWALTVGYVGTKGTALFEGIDGNPALPGSRGLRRVDPARGVITERCNCSSSTFHSLQTSLEKRLSRSFEMAAHYTWSSFIDSSSDALVTIAGDVGIAQDPFNRRAERGRSAFDRPLRFVANGVWELPSPRGWVGRGLLGGWQVSGFVTLQSGAPFTALDGADPGFRLSGLAPTVRANVNTNLDLARMSVSEILQAGGAALFRRVTAADPLGNIGRNALRSSGIKNVDLGLAKNTRIGESARLQLRAEFYNLTNTRSFGIPEARVNSANFLNQWGTNGGNRRIVVAVRFVF
jgi:hypothetical protein